MLMDNTTKSEFYELMGLLADKPSVEILDNLKKELNKYFSDSECKEVIFTNNTDKMFFGIKVMPVIDADEIYDYISGDEKIRIEEYLVEFDSKLFDPTLGLSIGESTALLLWEVDGLIGRSEPVDALRNYIAMYFEENNTHLKISLSIHYREILAYGIKDFISKYNSIFYIEDSSDILSNDWCVLKDATYSAYNKISNGNIKMYENSSPLTKAIVLCWTLDLYANLKKRRVRAIKTLNRLIDLSASRLEKMECSNVIKRIPRIDDDDILTESSMKLKLKEKLKKARMNSLKSITSTFYELAMRVRNVEDEEDALYLMRQINNNISVIENYKDSKDCDKQEFNEWISIMDKFIKLRETLSSATVYKNKSYGLFVNYPEIVEDRY